MFSYGGTDGYLYARREIYFGNVECDKNLTKTYTGYFYCNGILMLTAENLENRSKTDYDIGAWQVVGGSINSYSFKLYSAHKNILPTLNITSPSPNGTYS